MSIQRADGFDGHSEVRIVGNFDCYDKIVLIGCASRYSLKMHVQLSSGNRGNVYNDLSSDTTFPIMWHFEKCRLGRACSASF